MTGENTNLKVQLQIQEDTVTALMLKLDDSSNATVKTTELQNEVIIEEGPLPQGKRKCSFCNFTTKNSVLMDEHIAIHKQPQIFKCNQCRYTNKNREALRGHIETHKQLLELECNLCNHTNKIEAELVEHKKKSQGGTITEV